MLDIIIHWHPQLERTINSILLTTPPHILGKIMVVGGEALPPASTISGDNLYQACNAAASLSGSEYLTFITNLTILQDDWCNPLIADLDQDDRLLVTTNTHTLDNNILQLEPRTIGTSSFDWALNLQHSFRPTIISDGPLAIKTARFLRLGGFDHQLTSGHNLELCIKNWLCGGSTKVSNAVTGTIPTHQIVDDGSASRIANIWFDNSLDRFNRVARPEIGQWDATYQIKQACQTKTIRWLVDKEIPTLGKIYDLHHRYAGKTAAILCDGPSLDAVHHWDIYKHGFTIGLDYVPSIFPCDFAVSLHKDPVRSITIAGKYKPEQLLLPEVLTVADGVGTLPTQDVVAGAVVFSTLDHGVTPSRPEPPFMYSGHSLVTAIHLAAFLGATKIVLYGWDGKLVAGRSHTAAIPHYNGGRYLPDNQHTKDMYAAVNANLEIIARVLFGYGVTVLRYCYV